MDFQKILSSRGLNTLMFTDPYAKLCLTSLLANSFEKTIYVDLDTTYAAYLQAGMIRTTGKVDVLLPSEGRLVPMVKDVLASMRERSLVIFDSVNSFYSLFHAPTRTLGSLNHLLSILLMLLVKRGSEENVPVLVTSMLRYRQAGGWVQSPASRRLLQNKSAVRMKVEIRQAGDLGLTVIAHDSIPAGQELVLDAGTITA